MFQHTPVLATETLIQIFKDLDIYSLRSCALVNRYWCQIAIPMLWVEPFENIYEETFPSPGGNYHKEVYVSESIKNLSSLTDTYINCLSEGSKVKLTNAGIVGFYKTKHPSYDYPAFLKNLDIICLFLGCRAWLSVRFKFKLVTSVERSLLLYQIRLIFFELCKLFMSRCEDVKKLYLINKKFSKELECAEKCNENCLKFCLINNVINPIINHLPDLPGASKCLANLECLGTNCNTPTEFIQKISFFCKEIKNLIFTPGFRLSILSSQNCLKYLILQGQFYNYYPGIKDIFERAFKNLEWLTINGRDALPIKNVDSFENLVSLEVVNKDQSYNQSYNAFRTLADMNFPKLQYLYVDIGSSCFSYFYLLSIIISKTTNLRKLDLHWGHQDVSNFATLTLSIANHCPNLIILKMYWVNEYRESINDLLRIFKYCDKLEYLGILNNGIFDEDSYLPLLGDHLPPNLRVLKHCCVPVDYPAEPLESFFKNASRRLNVPLMIDLNSFITHEHSKIAQEYFLNGLINPSFTKFDYERRLEYYSCNMRYLQ
ncbi:11406_t:CDS:1 [Funneliformis caledonium]|uniref:11406_t:CDS:1 n=1 Tax=Funneliformis caledonium TaxID=1117310 RepID=A0A9N9DL63_9GLOM|nr:11406_t:CDS:1 [Funneliformis caledonium]